MNEFEKILIFYAHPETNGHCSAILENVEKILRDRGQSYKLIDLYKVHYDPVLKSNEHYTSGNKFVSDENKHYQEMIRNADKLIFIFPIWWGQMPAILKGFIDRVFVSGYAFKYYKFIDGIWLPHGLLNSKKALVFMTAGTRWIFYFLGFAISPKKDFLRMIFNFCGFKTKILTLYNATNVTANLDKIHNLSKNGLDWLF